MDSLAIEALVIEVFALVGLNSGSKSFADTLILDWVGVETFFLDRES